MNELSDKFLNDELNENELNQFNELLKTPDFLEKTYLNLLLKQSFEINEEVQFLHILKEVEQIHHYQQTYTLEELLAYFTPIQEYEEILSTITRASELQIIHPKNHINCVNHLYFEWKDFNNMPLILIIENNEYDVIIRQEIPPQTLSFSLNLSTPKGFKPGRYYWKLASRRHEISLMGVFFIGKGLMNKPNQQG